ncbi:MAG TPA: beta-ketoacyl-[acyl-carrier-protein] synthase family protein, partial [Nitrospirota bacterium]
MTRRVVITGIGAVTTIGLGVDGLREGLRKNLSGIGAVTRFDASGFRSQVAGEVHGFSSADFISRKAVKRMDRFSEFAVVSARMAAEDAGLDPAKVSHAGVVMGSALGGTALAEDQHVLFMQNGLKSVNPNLALQVFGAAGSSQIAIELGLKGPNITNSNSCSSGTIAVGEAFEMIRTGRADVIFAGGAEAPLSPLTFASFTLIRAMSSRNDDPAGACRPFDSGRDGFVMGEGSAVMVMESLEHAQTRGAKVYAEVLGYGLTNDAYHMTSSRDDGECAADAINIAMKQAGIRPEQLGYISAHGSSTQMNDKNETAAVVLAFGEAGRDIPISATKPYHAHPLGATGAIEAAICALAIYDG